MKKRRQWVLVLGGLGPLLLLVGVLLWAFRTPFLLMTLEKGQDKRDVLERLGPPSKEWSKEGFSCLPQWPCAKTDVRGGVLFYVRMGMGWYVYFDEAGRVSEVEMTGS